MVTIDRPNNRLILDPVWLLQCWWYWLQNNDNDYTQVFHARPQDVQAALRVEALQGSDACRARRCQGLVCEDLQQVELFSMPYRSHTFTNKFIFCTHAFPKIIRFINILFGSTENYKGLIINDFRRWGWWHPRRWQMMTWIQLKGNMIITPFLLVKKYIPILIFLGNMTKDTAIDLTILAI